MTESKPDEWVLVVAPVGQDAAAMAGLLEAEGFRCLICNSLGEASENLVNAETLVLTEEALELPQVSNLLDALKAQPPWSELPLVVLTSGGESRMGRLLDLMAEAAGSLTLLERPMSAATLLRSVHVAQRSRRRQYQVRDLLSREQALRGEAETANRLKDEFLATVSHELRTPMNAILGWATLIRERKLDQKTMARALETIERNARAQAQLIEDILDVSRMISGQLRLTVKPIELISVVKATADSVQPAVDAKGLTLTIAPDHDSYWILGDANRMQQVIWNLLSNAVKFTPMGGRVEIKLEHTDSSARVVVSDNGTGINPQFLSHVFEPFRQADGTITRRQAGLGLGLAITHRLVEMHGGTISASSEGEGKGASFTVTIPLLTAVPDLVATPSESPATEVNDGTRANTESPNLSGLKVLAVDDEPDTREMIKGVLEQFGANVMTVNSADDAFEALAAWKPNMLICDIGMPGEDGYSLMRRIREVHATQGGNTPAIALTGYARVEDRARALAAGFQMFVPKPVEANELVTTVVSLVGKTV